MKVLLINGSPNPRGCTFTALSEVAGRLKERGADSEIFQIGRDPVRGCIACGACRRTGRCVFGDDRANDMAEAIAAADGIVVGSPVYYAGPNGALCALMDRAFYSSAPRFRYKPAAAVVSCRRQGSTASLDRLQKYFTINHMPVVSSQYWCAVHGNTPEEVARDLEGLQIMRTLADNMVFMLNAIAKSDPPPTPEGRVSTNFIR